MARAVQNHHGDIRGGDSFSLGNGADVDGYRCVNVNDTCGFGANSDFLHVEHCGWVIHGAAFCGCED